MLRSVGQTHRVALANVGIFHNNLQDSGFS